MKNNSLMEIISSTNLDEKFLKYFSLYKKSENINLNKSLMHNLKSNITLQLYDIMHAVFVSQYNSAIGNKIVTGTTFEDRVKSFKSIVDSPNYISNLFIEYPVLEQIIFITLNDYLDSINELISNYVTDKEEIEKYFNVSFGEILRINMDLGDKHNGRSVAKVDFEKGSLIYKPKNLLSDKLYIELLDFMERNNVIDFKCYKSYCSSSHSWQELVIHKPNLSIKEANRYYYRAGVLLSILFSVRGSDIHHENIIASGEYPIIIDTETITSASLESTTTNNKGRNMNQSILSTAMLPIYDGLYDVNVSGLFYKEELSKTIYYYTLIENCEHDFAYEKRSASTSMQKNLIYIDGKLAEVNEVKKFLIDGFDDGARCILKNKQEFIKIIQSDKYKDTKIRSILRGTQVYYTFIRESKNVQALKDEKKYNRIFDILLKSFSPSQFGFLRVEEEVNQLRNLNIPLFYTKMNDKNLYSENKVICDDYFAKTPLQNILDAISLLDDKMIQYQKHLIELSLFTFTCKEEDINTLATVTKKKTVEYDIKKCIDEYIYELLDYELPLVENDTSSIYISHINEEGLKIGIINSGLYMGGGIVHFLYTYAYAFNVIEIQLFAKRLIKGLYSQYLVEKDSLDSMPYGVYEGHGGLIYLAYNYHKMYNDSEIQRIYYEIIDNICIYYSENMFDPELDADYINGMGGTIFLLGRLFHEQGIDENIKNKIINIFYKYYFFIKDHYLNEIGIAHGLSGNSMVLSFIYKALKENEILDLIYDLLDKEGTKIEQALRNKNLGYTWCRGLSGILLSRCIIMDNIGKTPKSSVLNRLLLKEINKYSSTNHIQKMIEVDNICFCHGISGNIDALVAIKKSISALEDEVFLNHINYREEDLYDYKWFEGSQYQFESFMLGKSGLMYSLFHIMGLKNIPSVNSLELFSNNERIYMDNNMSESE